MNDLLPLKEYKPLEKELDIVDLVAFMQKFYLLNHYTITILVMDEPHEDDEDFSSVEVKATTEVVTGGYLQVNLRVYPSFFNSTLEQQIHIMCHEFSHIMLAPIRYRSDVKQFTAYVPTILLDDIDEQISELHESFCDQSAKINLPIVFSAYNEKRGENWKNSLVRLGFKQNVVGLEDQIPEHIQKQLEEAVSHAEDESLEEDDAD